jgi:hypothetical protein
MVRHPTIPLQAGKLHEIASEAGAALIATVPFYARGGEVVRPIVEEVTAFGSARLPSHGSNCTVDLMRLSLAHGRFEYDGGAAMVAADPPHDLAKVVQRVTAIEIPP